jgi:hypothetical protein
MDIKLVGLAVGLSLTSLNCGGGSPDSDGAQVKDATGKLTMTSVRIGLDGTPTVRKSFHTAEEMKAKRLAKLDYDRARAQGIEVQPSGSEDGCEWWYLWMYQDLYTPVDGNMCCAWAEGHASVYLPDFCGYSIRSYYSGDQPGLFSYYPACSDSFGTNELQQIAPCQPSVDLWL